jgi:ABC-type glycerol-3-phosphate transport system permease component
LAPTAFEQGILVLLALIFLLPMTIVVISAFKTNIEILQAPLALPTRWSLDTFIRAWTVGRFGQYFWNTVLYTVTTVLAACGLASLGGYALARITFPGRGIVLGLLLLGLIIPFQAIMVPTFYLLNDLHLLGTYAGTILVSTALALPFGIFVMRAFFRSLPVDIVEAARLEGAGEFRVFARIMLPLAGPGLATIAVFQFLTTWNAFLIPLITAPSEQFRPMAVGLMFFSQRFSTDQALESAAIIIMNIPVVVLFLALRRYFIRGVSSSITRL